MQLWRSMRGPVLALGLTAVAPTAGDTADQNDMIGALKLYNSGRVLDAVKKFEEIIAASVSSTDRAGWMAAMLQLCASAEDYACLVRNGPAFVQTLHEARIDDPRLIMRARYTFVLERAMAGEFKEIEDGFTADFANRIGNPLVDRELSIDLQIVAARVQRYERHYKEAQTSIARALAMLFLSQPSERWFVARTLSQIIRWLGETGDVPKAWAWMEIVDPFISATLVPSSPEFAQWLVTKADLLARGPIGPQLSDALTRAADAVSKLQIEAEEKTARGSRFLAHLAAIRILMRDPAAAKAILAEHPVSKHREEVIGAKSFRSWSELLYAVAEIFVASGAGEIPDAGWLPAFDRVPEWADSPEFLAEVQSFQHFARAMLLARSDPDAARRELREAAQLRIGQLSADLSEEWDGFPLPSDVDRVILRALLPYLGRTAAQDQGAADLLLQATELLNRSLRNGSSDALSIVAAEPNEETRRLAHSALRLASQQADWERRRLQEFLAAMSQPAGIAAAGGAGGQARFGLARQMAEFVHLRRKVAAALHAKGVDGSVRGRLPQIGELQSALRPGEVFLTHVATLSGYLRICVRHDLIFTNQDLLDVDQTRADLRTLSNALSATHPPSEALDRQYPAQAAVRLYKVLFGGLSQCIPVGSHIVFAPTADLAGLPLAALLTEVPPPDSDGYDLSRAHWLALDFRFSYVASIQGFLAARQASGIAGGDLPFLGVGDPLLSAAQVSSDAAASSQTWPGAAASSDEVRALGSLPQTRAEIALSQSFFRDRGSTVLLGAEATEERLRLLPLSRYDIVQFATHGLMRDELPGLPEAALVLTPGKGTARLDDGLLIAGEIASLEFRARLVVLSACNTANLDLRQFGTELQGLTASLAVSGVPAVVASLWPVETETSQQLMTRFLGGLTGSSRPSVADAFAAAVRETIEQAPSPPFRHPRFWAAFIVLGDGAVAANDVSLQSGPKVLATVATGIPFSGQNRFGAASPESASYFVSQAGPYDGKPSGAVVERRTADGQTRWRVADPRLATGPIATGQGSVFVGGYELHKLSTAVVRDFSLDGMLMWERDFDRRADLGHVSDLLAIEDGGAIAAVADEHFDSPEQPTLAISVLRLDRSGVQTAEASISQIRSTFPAGTRQVAMAYDGDVLLVAVNSGRDLLPGYQGFDDFYLPRVCFRRGTVRISVHDPRTLVERRHRVIEDLSIDVIVPHEGGFLVSGARLDRCDLRRSAFAGRMTAELNQETLWQDDGPFDSWATGIVATPDGYRVGGTLTRTVAINENDPSKELEAWAKDAVGSGARSQATARSEAFLVEVPHVGTARRAYFDAGSSTSFAGLLPGNGQVVAFGSVAYSPLWMLVGE